MQSDKDPRAVFNMLATTMANNKLKLQAFDQVQHQVLVIDAQHDRCLPQTRACVALAEAVIHDHRLVGVGSCLVHYGAFLWRVEADASWMVVPASALRRLVARYAINDSWAASITYREICDIVALVEDMVSVTEDVLTEVTP